MFVLSLSLLAALAARADDDPLGPAVALYMSAAYEDALAALNHLPPEADADQADKYRALCLVGLNRSQEAVETIERLVTRRPLLKVDESDSPKLVLMYRAAKAHVIPDAAKTLYAAAKEHFEGGDSATAAAEFQQVVALVSEATPGDRSLADLKMLAEGFGTLATQQVQTRSAAGTAKIANGVAAAAVAVPEVTTARAVARIFDTTDGDVAPPVVITQTMPRWEPRQKTDRKKYSGSLEVVVDENGRVSAASLSSPIYPAYDQVLLQATKSWRYRPARKDGQPVKYRRAVAVVLAPSSP
ncbi:MAG: hypothetical protein JWL71_4353 [Acidobacteria bacterium]|nr:hypothetical protein [Acidobacteriota bacterium]